MGTERSYGQLVCSAVRMTNLAYSLNSCIFLTHQSFIIQESPLYINQFLLDDLSSPVADIVTVAYPFLMLDGILEE